MGNQSIYPDTICQHCLYNYRVRSQHCRTVYLSADFYYYHYKFLFCCYVFDMYITMYLTHNTSKESHFRIFQKPIQKW